MGWGDSIGGWWNSGGGDTAVAAYSAYEQKRAADAQTAAMMNINAENVAVQKEFAQQGIRWRVEDAIAAGIHPLAALGANLVHPTPAAVGVADTGRRQLRSDLAKILGQDIRRAAAAKMTLLERRLLEARVRKEEADAQMGELNVLNKEREVYEIPALPSASGSLSDTLGIPGQGDSSVIDRVGGREQNGVTGAVRYKDRELPMSDQRGLAQGIPPLLETYIDPYGYGWQLLTQGASEPMESSWYDQAKYAFQKGLTEAQIKYHFYQPDAPGKKEHYRLIEMTRPTRRPVGWAWRMNPHRGQWRLVEEKDIVHPVYTEVRKRPVWGGWKKFFGDTDVKGWLKNFGF